MTRVKLKEATRELLADTIKVKEAASHARKRADVLLQSLRTLESGFAKAGKEKYAEMTRAEAEKQRADHLKEYVMRDTGERAGIEAAEKHAIGQSISLPGQNVPQRPMGLASNVVSPSYPQGVLRQQGQSPNCRACGSPKCTEHGPLVLRYYNNETRGWYQAYMGCQLWKDKEGEGFPTHSRISAPQGMSEEQGKLIYEALALYNSLDFDEAMEKISKSMQCGNLPPLDQLHLDWFYFLCKYGVLFIYSEMGSHVPVIARSPLLIIEEDDVKKLTEQCSSAGNSAYTNQINDAIENIRVTLGHIEKVQVQKQQGEYLVYIAYSHIEGTTAENAPTMKLHRKIIEHLNNSLLHQNTPTIKSFYWPAQVTSAGNLRWEAPMYANIYAADAMVLVIGDWSTFSDSFARAEVLRFLKRFKGELQKPIYFWYVGSLDKASQQQQTIPAYLRNLVASKQLYTDKESHSQIYDLLASSFREEETRRFKEKLQAVQEEETRRFKEELQARQEEETRHLKEEMQARSKRMLQRLIIGTCTVIAIVAGFYIIPQLPGWIERFIGELESHMVVDLMDKNNTLPTGADTAEPSGLTASASTPTSTATNSPTPAPSHMPTTTPTAAQSVAPLWGVWSEWSTTEVEKNSTTEVEEKVQYRSRTIYNSQEYANWSDWSEWSTTAASKSSTKDVETKTEYRYRDTTTQTQYSDWSSWSDWITTAVSETNLLDVETKTEENVTYAYTYKHWHYTHKKNGAQNSYAEYKGSEYVEGSGKWEYYTVSSPLKQTDTKDGHKRYKVNGVSWYHETKNEKKETTTYYRYRTRNEQQVTVTGSWSNWSTTEVTATSTREVQTQTLYRFRTREVETKTSYGDWSSWSDKWIGENSERDVQTRKVYRYRRLQ